MLAVIGWAYQNSRIIEHILLRLSVLLLFFSNLDVLDIGSAKNNVVELLGGSGDEVFGWTTFSAERVDIF